MNFKWSVCALALLAVGSISAKAEEPVAAAEDTVAVDQLDGYFDPAMEEEVIIDETMGEEDPLAQRRDRDDRFRDRRDNRRVTCVARNARGQRFRVIGFNVQNRRVRNAALNQCRRQSGFFLSRTCNVDCRVHR